MVICKFYCSKKWFACVSICECHVFGWYLCGVGLFLLPPPFYHMPHIYIDIVQTPTINPILLWLTESSSLSISFLSLNRHQSWLCNDGRYITKITLISIVNNLLLPWVIEVSFHLYVKIIILFRLFYTHLPKRWFSVSDHQVFIVIVSLNRLVNIFNLLT